MVLVACSGGKGVADRATSTTAPAAGPTTASGPTTSLPAATSPSCPTIPARAEPRADRPRYVLHADVRPGQGTVDGDLRVAFTPDLPTGEIVFRLWPNGPRPAVTGAHLDAGPVTVDGASAPATKPDDTTLVVDPGRTIAAGTTVDIALPWKLVIPGPANDRLALESDSMRLGSFFPILPWEPGVGWAREAAVGDFAEASTAPTADFDLTVTVPPGYTVLASGEPAADNADPSRPSHFVATAMRDVALSVGHFTDVATTVAHAPSAVTVTVGRHDGMPGDAHALLAQVVQVLQTFGTRYGPYPWTTLTLALTPGLGGGIEYPSHIMLGPFTEGEIATHEVGHMWFYALVGNDQGRDPWLDEGLTSFAEARQDLLLDFYETVPVPRSATGRLGEPMSYWTLRPDDYQDGVYSQGVQALIALGPPDLVDCALRVYVAQNAYRIATPADFVAAASAVFPDAAKKLAIFGIEP
ncbi:MAG: hypothetical protein QOG43_1820 [Actinomycetota bacterium]|jgi:hypothetical protein|nr:hypothetical protein [Actinomycetota bacterium]